MIRALFLVVLSVFQIIPAVCHAEMSYLNMKGVHSLISPQYEYLSPIYGFTLLGTRTLQNRRFYGNYGPAAENSAFGCMDHASNIHAQLLARNDCPRDFTSEWIQRLFPSQDGVSFVINLVHSDPVSHLDPETIGGLLGRIAGASDADFMDSAKLAQLTSDLKRVLFRGLNLKRYLNQQFADLKKQRKAGHTPQERNDLAAQIARVEIEIENAPHGVGKEKDFESIARLLVESLKESRIEPLKYPRHLIEQTLLAFFIKKGRGDFQGEVPIDSEESYRDKKDFLKLLKAMPNVLADPSGLESNEGKTHFIESKYSEADYFPNGVVGSPELLAEDFLFHPEKLVFLSQFDLAVHSPLPPIFSYGYAKHSSLADNGQYADCGETALRNFFNIVLLNRQEGVFDTRYLTALREGTPGLEVDANLISFYETHKDMASITGQIARDDWSENVVSQRVGVDYLDPNDAPQCDMSSGIDNMLNLVDQLIRVPGSSQDRRSDRLDLLCRILSREDFLLSWNLKEGSSIDINNKNVGIDIEFRINGERSFVWSFGEMHFAIQQLDKRLKSWKDEVGLELAKIFTIHRYYQVAGSPWSREPSDFSYSASLLNWFTSQLNWEEVMDTLSKGKLSDDESITDRSDGASVYALPLSMTEGKLVAFKGIVKNQLKAFYPLAQRLEKKLLLEDPSLKSKISIVLADNDYPWGEPKETVTGVVYQRVTDRPNLSALGKSWWNPKDYRGVIWGDLVKTEDGKDRKMDFAAADNYCKSIGARLPTIDEFLVLASDMGHKGPHSNSFVPQFLPHLTGRWYWSSTTDNVYRSTAKTFQSGYGFVNLVHREVGTDLGAVRCVVQNKLSDSILGSRNNSDADFSYFNFLNPFYVIREVAGRAALFLGY